MNRIGSYLSILCLCLSGCQATPTVTRTGDVKDVTIGDDLTSGDIAINPGDEVRWVNKRTAPVRVVIIDPLSDKQVSCKSNFGGFMTPGDTAQLAMNESASLCFRDAGTFRYTVRMTSTRTTGEINVPGVIKVGGQGGQAVDQTSEQNRGRSSGQASQPLADKSNDPMRDKPSEPTIKPDSPSGSTSTTTTTTTTMPSK
jgi:hypothetical protein